MDDVKAMVAAETKTEIKASKDFSLAERRSFFVKSLTCMYATLSILLLILTLPHLRIFISSGPNFLLSFRLIINSDDLAVILSSPIKIAWKDFKDLLFFFSFKFWAETLSFSSSNISKLGLISSTLINGVEILNYKSNNKIFFGPLDKINLLNGGLNYDVITPPPVTITTSGIGNTTALMQPVINGEVTNIQVEPQDFDIEKVLSATIEGGNGNGVILESVLSKRKRWTKYSQCGTIGLGALDDAAWTFQSLPIPRPPS